MSVLLEQRVQTRTRPKVDERAARAALRAQVARLEEERAGLVCSSWPRVDRVHKVGRSGGAGARALSIGELEEARDRLAAELREAKRRLAAPTAVEEENRRLHEEMLLH